MVTKRWILLAIMLVSLVGCAQKPVQVKPSTTPIPDETNVPLQTPVRTGVTILADGVVQAVQPVLLLGFKTGGKLFAVHVQTGDLVGEGDVLAQLNEAEPLDAYQAAVISAELSVLVAQQSLDDLSKNAALRQAEALQAILSAQQALDALAVDTPIQQSEALQAIAQAQEAVRAADYRFNSMDAPATEASVTAAQSDVTLTGLSLTKAEEAYAPYRNKPDGNLNKAHYGAVWAAAQKAYDAAVRQLNALTGSPSDLTRAQKEATLAVAKAQLTLAQATYDALSDGIPPSKLAVVEAQLAGAQTAYNSLENGIDPDELVLTEAELAYAQIHLTLARNDLAEAIESQDDIFLVAPWTGTVLSVDVAPGSLVGSGSPIVTLLDTTQLEFHTTNLSERDLAQIYPGQTAVVTLKTYPNEPIEAMVVRIGWQAGALVGDAATFPVMLVLSDTDLDIRLGMTGRVEIRSDD